MFTIKEQAELMMLNSMSDQLYENVMNLLYGESESESETYFISSCQELNFD